MTPDPIRQCVLADMAYEIGGAGLAKFTNMLAAYRVGLWASTAVEIKNSLLFTQAPEREQRNIMIMALGKFPAGITCGEDLTKCNEGLTLVAKPDAQGKWEYGYGEDIPAPADPSNPPTCTPEEALQMFNESYQLAKQRAMNDVGPEYWYTPQTTGDVS